ncbi:MAG: hypothetical protein KU37_02700 [Sulfuricurvum sp. PC08-66]|nr:MAG: hypothetical protein KU37_02700 [Sulfuricurvum sp. PC08-66]
MDERRRSKLLSDLEGMTMSHKQNIMQIAAFQTVDEVIYGINIAKIKEFAMIKDAQVTHGLSENPYQMGIAVLRGESFPVVNLAKWMGQHDSNENDLRNFDIFIVCEFNQNLIAFPVKKILMIASKHSEELERPSTTDSKLTYITRIQPNQEIRRSRRRRSKIKRETKKIDLSSLGRTEKSSEGEKICFVIDVEQMLEDIFPSITQRKIAELDEFEAVMPIKSDKILVVCEDSPVATTILHKTLDKTKLDIHYFRNGMEFHTWAIKSPDIAKRLGCVITDIEMPLMDGFQVVNFVKTELNSAIPVIVNTSMSNIGVVKKLEDMGVDLFIPKTEPVKIYRAVKALMEGKDV